MNITRFEPWTLLNLVQRDLDRATRRQVEVSQINEDDKPRAVWRPAVDIIEQKDSFILRADLPGVSADDIDVNMDGGVLSLCGEKAREAQDETSGLKHLERISGRFYRQFNLPETADAEGISAKSANGILEITIPKVPQIEARRITVKAA